MGAYETHRPLRAPPSPSGPRSVSCVSASLPTSAPQAPGEPVRRESGTRRASEPDQRTARGPERHRRIGRSRCLSHRDRRLLLRHGSCGTPDHGRPLHTRGFGRQRILTTCGAVSGIPWSVNGSTGLYFELESLSFIVAPGSIDSSSSSSIRLFASDGVRVRTRFCVSEHRRCRRLPAAHGGWPPPLTAALPPWARSSGAAAPGRPARRGRQAHPGQGSLEPLPEGAADERRTVRQRRLPLPSFGCRGCPPRSSSVHLPPLQAYGFMPRGLGGGQLRWRELRWRGADPGLIMGLNGRQTEAAHHGLANSSRQLRHGRIILEYYFKIV